MDETLREYHEVAQIFPLMQGEEFEELKRSIRENGYDKSCGPIWLDKTGKIIDGRNRHRACIETNIEPIFDIYQNDDLVEFAIRMNLQRRHLNSSQCATVALDILPLLEKEAKERKLLNLKQNITEVEIIPRREEYGKSRDKAAEVTGTNAHYVGDAKKLQDEAPDLLELVKIGKLTIPAAIKKLKERERLESRAEIAEAGSKVAISDRWHIYHGDIQAWQIEKQYDYIITDPPYPKEYLPLWETLAIRADEWLKDGGLLIAMSGQSYLDEIYNMLSKHLEYYWIACYLTPGQPTPLRQVNVNTTWKPLLMFTKKNDRYKGKIFGDVFKSDGNDKDFHKWGQSESGMLDIVSKICLPGQSILDPFCGAGTTGIAAIKHDCFFDGLELDPENVNISKARLNDQTT